ncbi:hypothetical protein ACFTWS_05895 [Streptomyces sp. NPDC057027]
MRTRSATGTAAPSKAPTASARWSPSAGRVREAYGDRIYRRLAEVEATY